jgi:4-hydroxyphenylpyruvate dioxygenase
MNNPIGIEGFDFLEYSSEDAKHLHSLFHKLGMRKTGQHKKRKIALYEQNDVKFLVNEDSDSFAAEFRKSHGPSVCAMGWKVTNAQVAFEKAVANGARPYKGKDTGPAVKAIPAVYGIGDSLIYFVDAEGSKSLYGESFNAFQDEPVQEKGLIRIDHLTNNVPRGEMQKWCDFYRNIFNFEEVRYFDIKGTKTGLISKVMVSPGFKVMIPINEPSDTKSQIQEYLDEYKGSGIQHIAFLTPEIIPTIAELTKAGIVFLDAPPGTYYEELKKRVPPIREDEKELQKLSILGDGDKEGYILQIFTKNAIGPIFYEFIQREKHMGFGDGNFQALFDAIERDQVKRGYIK